MTSVTDDDIQTLERKYQAFPLVPEFGPVTRDEPDAVAVAKAQQTIDTAKANLDDAKEQARREGRDISDADIAVLDQEAKDVAASRAEESRLEAVSREVHDMASEKTHQDLAAGVTGLAAIETFRQMLPGFSEAMVAQIAAIAEKAKNIGIGDMEHATGEDYFVTVDHGIGARGEKKAQGQLQSLPA